MLGRKTIAKKIIAFSSGLLVLFIIAFVYIESASYDIIRATQNQTTLMAKQQSALSQQLDVLEQASLAAVRVEQLKDVIIKFRGLRVWLLDLAAGWQNDAESHAKQAKSELFETLTGVPELDSKQVDTLKLAVEEFYSQMITGVDAYVNDNRVQGNSIVFAARNKANDIEQQLLTWFNDAKKAASTAGRDARDAARNAAGINKEVDIATRSINEGNGQIQVALLNLFGLTVSGLVAMLLFFSRAVLQPMRRLIRAMDDIARGDGDLSQRLPVIGSDEFAHVAVDFNLFVDKIHRTVTGVTQSVEQITIVADHMIGVTKLTREGVTQQQLATADVTRAISELSKGTDRMEAHAHATSGAAEEAGLESEAGRKVVEEAIQAINELASHVERGAAVIQTLSKNAENIGGILDVIREIANQTNLLALNAAIESARAGEQGRGFAVVADEVRTLAQRTQDSTAEINTLIEELRSVAKDAVAVMNEGSAHGQTTIERAARVTQSLEKVNHSIVRINELDDAIVMELKAQVTAANAIEANLRSIKEIADQTSINAQNTAERGSELQRVTHALNEVCSHFKV